MKLQKVYFDAYKSLLNEELEINEDCVGCVGINESGKSNVLKAISALSSEVPLVIADSPRMAKGTNPSLRFEFILDKEIKEELSVILNNWNQNLNIEKLITIFDDCKIIFNVKYDLKIKKEKRYFTIENLKSIPKNIYFTKENHNCMDLKWKRGDEILTLKDIHLTNENEIKENINLRENANKFFSIEEECKDIEVEILNIEKEKEQNPVETKLIENNSKNDKNQNNSTLEVFDILQKLKKNLEKLEKEKDLLLKNTNLDYHQLFPKDLEDQITLFEQESIKNVNEINELNKKIDPIEKVAQKTPEQTKQLTTFQTEKSKLDKRNQKIEEEKNRIKQLIIGMNEPIENNFTQEIKTLSKKIGSSLSSSLNKKLPLVVFWEYSKDYILHGETDFSIINSADSLNSISRPLVNMFRIGLGTRNLTELKEKINEIQTNASERSRYQAKLNLEVDKYLKSVWPDYDQKISISLEQERIRVLFFDPEAEDASFYEMSERSQGCQHFISFLLTVGAETKHGVITNTVLLLDEPETHLHPSGVRYMLKELITAAKNNNYVIFATHSIFMIDRKNYNRHIMLRKDKERTTISVSSKKRIGFFMQEEVLYGTLDIDLSTDFNSAGKYNFVFEGDGDAVLFNNFYEKALLKKDRPFDIDLCSFYQGGKCADIRKYFQHSPIQLGSIWIFILDSDRPANELVQFLKSRYKDFIDKYIFIFQYRNIAKDEEMIELEDLLPDDFINNTTKKTLEELNLSFENIPIKNKEILFEDHFNRLIEYINNEEGFKALFKTNLNEYISTEVEILKSKDKFREALQDYCLWADGTISSIADLINEKKATSPGSAVRSG